MQQLQNLPIQIVAPRWKYKKKPVTYFNISIQLLKRKKERKKKRNKKAEKNERNKGTATKWL